MNVISLRNVTKEYKMYKNSSARIKEAFSLRHKSYHEKFYALKDISFDVQKGELLGIIGKNGAGKSTLLKIITGVIEKSDGEVEVNGKIAALLELGAGFNMDYTGMENIYMVGMLSGFSKEEMNKKIDDIVDFAEIGDFINQPVKTYSSGMFARLAFALSINVDPDILIVDEALAVGDMKFQLKCMDKFNEFRDKGKTILFVTHDIHSVKRFCSRAIWLNHGEIVKSGNVNEVTDAYLDFLKIEQSEEIKTMEKTVEKEGNNEETKMVLKAAEEPSGSQVTITNFKLMNSKHEEINQIVQGEKIHVEVTYNIDNYTGDELVVGVAILRVDNMYICGLNTLLDKVEIPVDKKEGKVTLEYEYFDLLAGRYYFDCGIFEKNAYVALDYSTKIKEFQVVSDYVGEGIVVLKHNWRID